MVTDSRVSGERLTLDLADVQRATGLSRNAVYAAANRKELPGILRIGKRILVSKAAFEAALRDGWQPKQG